MFPALYGLPPITMDAMASGAGPTNTTGPAKGLNVSLHWTIPAYGVVLLVVAGLYFWKRGL